MLQPGSDGVGDAKAEDCADAGEQQTFREQLADDAAT